MQLWLIGALDLAVFVGAVAAAIGGGPSWRSGLRSSAGGRTKQRDVYYVEFQLGRVGWIAVAVAAAIAGGLIVRRGRRANR